jgi:hypothetical protein
MTGTDRFTEPDADPAWSESKAIVYAVIADQDELTDVLDKSEYSTRLHFNTPREALQFADSLGGRSVVRVTIEEEW